MGFLRILLGIAVCLTHTSPIGPFSWIAGITAVYVFFVISGFYMQMVLETRYTRKNLGDSWLRQFYLSRYLRLFPVYAIVMILSVGYSLFILGTSGTHVRPMDSWLAPAGDIKDAFYRAFVLLSNATMLGLNVPKVSDLAIGPSWSLGVEISFYLLAPFLLSKSTRFLVAAAAISVLLKLIPFNNHAPFFSGIDCFLLGALAFRWKNILTIRSEISWPDQTIVFAVVFALVAFALPHAETPYIPNTHLYLDTLIYPIIFAILIPSIFAATRHNDMDRRIGELSYPFYLLHAIVIVVLSGVDTGFLRLNGETLAAGTTLVTLILAFLLTAVENRWIEPYRARLSTPKGSPKAKRSIAAVTEPTDLVT